MRQFSIGHETREVVVVEQAGRFSARLYVNSGETATWQFWKGDSEAAARRWAAKTLGVPASVTAADQAEPEERDLVWEALESARAAARLRGELSLCELIGSIQAAREAGTVGDLAMLVELKWH